MVRWWSAVVEGGDSWGDGFILGKERGYVVSRRFNNGDARVHYVLALTSGASFVVARH